MNDSTKPTFDIHSFGFMFCIRGLPDWSIGLAMDWALGQRYFGHCIGVFLGAKKVKIINTT